jgi:hypothetical protein
MRLTVDLCAKAGADRQYQGSIGSSATIFVRFISTDKKPFRHYLLTDLIISLICMAVCCMYSEDHESFNLVNGGNIACLRDAYAKDDECS